MVLPVAGRTINAKTSQTECCLYLGFCGQAFNGYRAVSHQGGDGPNRRQTGQDHRSGHAECQGNLQQGRAFLVLNDDPPDVALVDQLLDLR